MGLGDGVQRFRAVCGMSLLEVCELVRITSEIAGARAAFSPVPHMGSFLN